MALRIAFDLDGVLADMESALVRQAEGVFGEATIRRSREAAVDSAANISPDARSDTVAEGSSPAPGAEAPVDMTQTLLKLNLTARQQRKLWRHVATIDNFWETLQELEPGVIKRLAGIAADRRWEIIFLTRRPQTEGSPAQVQSQRWLESKGFRLPSVYVVQGSRGQIAAALGLDVVIDDRPENCLDVVADSKARAILVWRGDPKQSPVAARRLGIGMVTSVGDCLDVLTQLDAAGGDQPGVMARVRRLLGLEEHATAS